MTNGFIDYEGDEHDDESSPALYHKLSRKLERVRELPWSQKSAIERARDKRMRRTRRAFDELVESDISIELEAEIAAANTARRMELDRRRGIEYSVEDLALPRDLKGFVKRDDFVSAVREWRKSMKSKSDEELRYKITRRDLEKIGLSQLEEREAVAQNRRDRERERVSEPRYARLRPNLAAKEEEQANFLWQRREKQRQQRLAQQAADEAARREAWDRQIEAKQKVKKAKWQRVGQLLQEQKGAIMDNVSRLRGQPCAAMTRRGTPCKNRSRYLIQGRSLCGVHAHLIRRLRDVRWAKEAERQKRLARQMVIGAYSQ